MVAERDVLIAELMQRVERLEGLWGAASGAPAATDAPPPPAPRPPSATGPAPAQSTAPLPAPARPPTGGVASTQGPERPAPPAPGQLEVEPEAIDRALERALVQTGALLLPPGSLEIEPSLSLSRREDDDPLFLQLTSADGVQFTTAGTREVRRTEVENSVALRLGMPFDSQVELEVPYRFEHVSTVDQGGSTRREDSNDGWGLGDISVGVAKTLMREYAWRPDLIGRVQWDTDTGQTDGGIALGSGFHEVRGSMTAVKRQDPLVFVGSVAYETAIENAGVDPGDEVTASIGTVLAASPETSLRFSFQQSFVGEAEVDGREIAGSDGVDATFVVGASSIIAPRRLLDVAAGIGVSDGGTDYTLTVSLPVRFNLEDFPLF